MLDSPFPHSQTVEAGLDAAAHSSQGFDGVGTLWLLLAAILVFFMQAGFGMVEAGMVRSKNAANVLFKNLLDFAFAGLAFFAFGYAIMFGGDGPILGTKGWFLTGLDDDGSIPLYAVWFFQAVFAGAAATIVAGAVAERMKFAAYLCYSFLITAFIYPVTGHWIWGGGWLADLGFYDFAGSTTVHAVGGTAALVGAWMLGPRVGRFREDGSPSVIAGHNLPLATLGVFILWFGWYGFNAGGQGFDDPAGVARIVINTTLAPSAGAIGALCVAWAWYGKPDLTISLNGALAGLVGITAPCLVVTPGAAIFIGLFAGALVVWGIHMLNVLRIDDPVGAVPVHGLCGVWGTLAVGLWGQESMGANADGLFHGGGFGALGIQCLGVVAALGFVALAMGVVFKAIDAVIGLRVSLETELRGLDIDEHGHESYSGFQIFTVD
ncbi:MAG: ammonium transporter [Planctomycetota bacterium]|jgi:Amt family ammonium transporter